MKKQISAIVLAITILLTGCAKERPVKTVINNGRVPKTAFSNIFFFHKMVTGARFAADTEIADTPVGAYQISDVLVQFKISENFLDVVSIDPLFKNQQAAHESSLLARFPIKHVDVLRKQNPDGDDTNEEEETDSRRAWNERAYIIVNDFRDVQDAFNEITTTVSSNGFKIDEEGKAINLSITRQLKDKAELTENYSFLKYTPSETYVQKEYPLDLQTKFGFFKTTTLSFDKYDRITQDTKKEFINRWDTHKKIVYYFSPNYPEHLKEYTRTVFAKWNAAFKQSTGHDTLEIRENTGQELGDLRYSMVYYDDTKDASHGILGRGPHYTNPRTGEVIKADVILFGGILKGAIFSDRIREKLLGDLTNGESNAEKETKVLLKAIADSTKHATPVNFKKIASLKSLLSKTVLDQELIKSALGEKTIQVAAKMIRKNVLKELRSSTTTVNDGILHTIKDRSSVMSDQEIEKTIFIPLLTHELGHTFGLRHNFMGSLDKAHFTPGAKTSTVMEYGYLSSHEGNEPGPYDKAAIMVSYSTDRERADRLLKENFFYCTDEHTMSSQTAFCNRFDAGTSLSEILTNAVAAYDASWIFRNTRMNGAFMKLQSDDYRNRVIMSLLPLRNIYDHANALLESIEDRNLNAVWLLGRQRVEADPSSDPTKIETVEILSGYKLLGEEAGFEQASVTEKRFVDKAKIEALRIDAELAKKLALEALRNVVISDARPNYNVYDSISGELQIRGVIYNKILALNILGARFSSPLDDGTVTTTFPGVGDEAVTPTLFRQVLSNIVLPGEPGSNPDPNGKQPTFDLNLRSAAMQIIREEFSEPGQAAQMYGLLAVALVPKDKTSEEGKILEDYKSGVRERLAKVYMGNLTEDERNKILTELDQLETKRNRSVRYAETDYIANRVYQAPLLVGNLGLTTATGFFIRDSINPYENAVAAMIDAYTSLSKTLQLEQAKAAEKQDKQLIEQLSDKLDDMGKSIQLLSGYIESQKATLDMMYRVYDKQQ